MWGRFSSPQFEHCWNASTRSLSWLRRMPRLDGVVFLFGTAMRAPVQTRNQSLFARSDSISSIDGHHGPRPKHGRTYAGVCAYSAFSRRRNRFLGAPGCPGTGDNPAAGWRRAPIGRPTAASPGARRCRSDRPEIGRCSGAPPMLDRGARPFDTLGRTDAGSRGRAGPSAGRSPRPAEAPLRPGLLLPQEQGKRAGASRPVRFPDRRHRDWSPARARSCWAGHDRGRRSSRRRAARACG